MEIDSIKDLIFYLIDKPGIIDINDKGKQFQTI